MNQTEYLKLNKPGYENLADIEVLNENFEKIDKNAQQGSVNLEDHLKVKSTQEKDGHMSKEDKVKLDEIAPGANNYTHPNTPSIRHVSDAEKSNWNGKEPGIIKKNAFNKDFGTITDSVLEGAKLAELLGCDYGGVLNNSNPKKTGLAYYCNANKSLFRCKKDTNLNYANLDYFEGYSHSDFASKLENLECVLTTNYVKHTDGRLEIYGSTAVGTVVFPVSFRDIGYNIKLCPMATGVSFLSISCPIQSTLTINGFQYKGMYWDEYNGRWVFDTSKFPLYYHVTGFWK